MPDNVKLMQSFLNYCSDKSKVLNQNIANINTENYKRQNVDFSSYLNSELASGMKSKEGQHLAPTQNETTLEDAVYTEDKRSTIEEEMAELARNTINFKFAAKRVGGYYKNIQSVIRSGGR